MYFFQLRSKMLTITIIIFELKKMFLKIMFYRGKDSRRTLATSFLDILGFNFPHFPPERTSSDYKLYLFTGGMLLLNIGTTLRVPCSLLLKSRYINSSTFFVINTLFRSIEANKCIVSL